LALEAAEVMGLVEVADWGWEEAAGSGSVAAAGEAAADEEAVEGLEDLGLVVKAEREGEERAT